MALGILRKAQLSAQATRLCMAYLEQGDSAEEAVANTRKRMEDLHGASPDWNAILLFLVEYVLPLLLKLFAHKED